MTNLASTLDTPNIRLGLALGLLWVFVLINNQRFGLLPNGLDPMMIIMFSLGAVVIFAALHFTQEDFAHELLEQ